MKNDQKPNYPSPQQQPSIPSPEKQQERGRVITNPPSEKPNTNPKK